MKKTEIILLGNKQLRKRVDVNHITLAGSLLPLADKVRDLGVIFDCELTMKNHISQIRRQSFSFLHIIGRMNKTITASQCSILINALVLSRITYCAPLLFGITKTELHKIQNIIDVNHRIVARLKKRHDRTSSTLPPSQWPLADKLIRLRACSLMFSVMKSGLPIGLSNLLKPMQSIRALRSSSQELLEVPMMKTKFGERSFYHYGPKLWNSIPLSIRNLRSRNIFLQKLTQMMVWQ